jgi:hypothetical protein
MGASTVRRSDSSSLAPSTRAGDGRLCPDRRRRRGVIAAAGGACAGISYLCVLRRPLAVAALLVGALASPAHAASPNPYVALPRAGDAVRFDGSAGGEHNAWAYPNQAGLEAFLRSTIDASIQAPSYDAYAKSAAGILNTSLEIDDGTQGIVQRVQAFTYRGHSDTEVQVRITSGPLTRALVWTTPAELVDHTGHRYLR